MARQDAIDYKKGRAFDAAEEEGGAEGEDHVGDAQRVLHRRHGLRVVGRHPPLHRLHRSAAAAVGVGPTDALSESEAARGAALTCTASSSAGIKK